jgi:CubicO group peptidase (beta-lactamase class C family)
MYATNYAIMHLVALGKIDLQAPIKTYIPNYTGCDANGQCRDDRKVIDILRHDAGYTPDPQFFNPATIGESLYSQDRNRTMALIESQLPFERPLGGAPVYSDVDFMLLGMIIEHVTGEQEDTYVENTFYKPLGLTHTMYNPMLKGVDKSSCAATEINGNTRGFTINFPNVRTTPIQCQVHDEKAYYSMGGVSGHAGLFSTLNDMAVLTQIMLNNGGYANHQFWNAAVESEFVAANPLDSSFGLGWRRAGEPSNRSQKWFSPYASDTAVGHTGWVGTVTVIDPTYHLAIVLLTNKRHSPFVNGGFNDDNLATANYTKIITLVYQAMDGVN